MQTIITTLLGNEMFVLALTGLLTAGVTYLGKVLSDFVRAKTAGTRWETGALQVATTVTNAVLMVEQTLVPLAIEAAKDGEIDAAEKEKLRQAAWNSIMSALGGDAGVTKIAKSMSMTRSQFELFVGHAIEATVLRLTK